MIILATTMSLVNQMSDVWKGLYTWLGEYYAEVHLVTWDIAGNIVFEGQIKVYLNDGAQVVFFNFDSTIVTIVIEQGPIGEKRDKVDLRDPDSLDRIWEILA